MQAVIFDLDGTLWDATAQTLAVWNRVFERHPEVRLRVTEAQKRDLMGKTMPEIGAALFPERDAADQRAIMDEVGLAEIEHLRKSGGTLYGGLRETLEALRRRYRLYIVSNCQDGYVQAFLSAHGLADYFDDFEMSGRTERPKGENIRLVMARNGIESAVYVGDTEGDAAAAAQAGIPFIHAAYGFGTVAAADAVIRDISELPDAMEALPDRTPSKTVVTGQSG